MHRLTKDCILSYSSIPVGTGANFLNNQGHEDYNKWYSGSGNDDKATITIDFKDPLTFQRYFIGIPFVFESTNVVTTCCAFHCSSMHFLRFP